MYNWLDSRVGDDLPNWFDVDLTFDLTTNTIEINLGGTTHDVYFASSHSKITGIAFRCTEMGYTYTAGTLTVTDFKNSAKWPGDSTGLDLEADVHFKLIYPGAPGGPDELFTFTMYGEPAAPTVYEQPGLQERYVGGMGWGGDKANFGLVYSATIDYLIFGNSREPPYDAPWGTSDILTYTSSSGGGSGDPFITTFLTPT